MSRSYRKMKIFANAGGSDKYDKRQANRRLRRVVRCGRIYTRLRDISNVWNWSKDGRHYWSEATDRDMRK